MTDRHPLQRFRLFHPLLVAILTLGPVGNRLLEGAGWVGSEGNMESMKVPAGSRRGPTKVERITKRKE